VFDYFQSVDVCFQNMKRDNNIPVPMLVPLKSPCNHFNAIYLFKARDIDPWYKSEAFSKERDKVSKAELLKYMQEKYEKRRSGMYLLMWKNASYFRCHRDMARLVRKR
jgi:hypothetical protein